MGGVLAFLCFLQVLMGCHAGEPNLIQLEHTTPVPDSAVQLCSELGTFL